MYICTHICPLAIYVYICTHIHTVTHIYTAHSCTYTYRALCTPTHMYVHMYTGKRINAVRMFALHMHSCAYTNRGKSHFCFFIQVHFWCTAISTWLVVSLQLHVSFAEYRLFHRALLQKNPTILRRRVIVRRRLLIVCFYTDNPTWIALIPYCVASHIVLYCIFGALHRI